MCSGMAWRQNAGLDRLGRNAGEVIGVFGTLEWQPPSAAGLTTLITGQHDTPYDVNYKSSPTCTTRSASRARCAA